MTALLHDTKGRRLYLTAGERQAVLAAPAKAPRPVRTLCGVLAHTGCRVSEALQLTPRRVDFAGGALVLENLKKLRKGVDRAVPVPPAPLLDQLDLVHGVSEARRRGDGHLDRPLWPWTRTHAWRRGAAEPAQPVDGHSSPEVTAIYADPLGAEEQGIVARMWL